MLVNLITIEGEFIMSIKKIFLTSLITSVLSFVMVASANADTAYGTGGNCPFYPGLYTGLNLGWAKFQNGSSSNKVAGQLFLGYDFVENFAAELGYTHLQASSNMVDLLARLNVPVTQYVSFYGKAGPAWVQENSSHAILPEAGVGVAFLPAYNTKIQVGYNHAFGRNDVSSLNNAYVGVAYKFAT